MEFHNEHLTGTVQSLPHCVRKFTIRVFAEPTKAARSKAARVINKKVSFPGFRKGRAPEAMVIKEYGNQVDMEFRKTLISSTFKDIRTLTNVTPLQENTPLNLQDFKTLDTGEAEVIFTMEVYPDLPEVDPTTLELNALTPKPVSEEDCAHALEQLCLYHATWKEVIDRPAQEGDYVVIDIDVLGSEPPHSAYQNSRFHLVDGKTPAWAKDLICGLKPGESREGHSQEQENVDPQLCRITLHAIHDVTLHPVDDQLAKKAGTESVEILKENIKKKLEHDAGTECQHEKRLNIMQKLVENYGFELPETVLKNVEQDLQARFSQAKKEIQQPEKLAEVEQTLRARLTKDAQTSFLLHKLVQEGHVPMPTSEDLRLRVLEYISHQNLPTEENLSREELFKRMENRAFQELVREKALDYLIDQAKVT